MLKATVDMDIIWIDALEFDDYGGFRAETQFVHEMGQGYLFACKVPGVPVDAATTKIKIERDATYRVWVRTKNWRQPEAPGRLKVRVDGAQLPRELGQAPIDSWYFEIAGDIHLTRGEHEIKVEDTTGYFGRFSSVIVTDDMDFMPEKQVEQLWKQRARVKGLTLEKTNAEHFDVVVAGAGPAGIPAAIAAARHGAKVALLHSRSLLGGNASDEGAVGLDGAGAVYPNMREGGIAEEIRRTRDHERITWGQALTRLVEAEPNIHIFRDEFVFDARVENDRIVSVKTLNCLTQTFTWFSGDIFIDCTGDGWLGYYAGALYRLGREARWQYNEPFAPDTPDSDTMSGCLMGGKDPSRQVLGYYAEKTDEDCPFCAPSWAVSLPEGDKLHRSPGRIETGEWWIENPTDFDDLWEQEKVRDELLRLNLGYFHWLKNSYSRRDVVRKYRITDFGRYNAKRETRRLIGDYVLTQNDCHGTSFDDAISYCGWPLDVHNPRGIYSGAEGPYYSNSSVPITGIPYRCIYSKNIDNLLMAGRCVSVSHLALGTVRVESTLATLGQAAGTAAAICAADSITPRDIYKTRMREFRQLLLRDDLTIPGLMNLDPDDLARTSKVSASSVSKTERFDTKRGAAGDFEEISVDTAAAMGIRQKVEFARVYLKSANPAATKIKASLLKLKSPSGFEAMEIADTVTVDLAAGYEGWCELPLDVSNCGGSVGILIYAAPGVYWKRMVCTSFRLTSAKRLNEYRWANDTQNSYMFLLYDEQLPYADCSAANVINGYSRIVDKRRYAWVSDPNEPLPQWIRLDFDQPREISEVIVITDTDLTTPAYSSPRLPIVTKTISDFTISVISGGTENVVYEVRGNYLRRRDCHFDKITADAVKITVTKTCGDASARIFEVRVY